MAKQNSNRPSSFNQALDPIIKPKSQIISNETTENEETGKVTASLPIHLIEKMKDWEYWEGSNHSTTVQEALELFFSDKNVVPRPDKVKNKPKPGRKKSI